MRGSNGIDKRTMVHAAFWRELMAFAAAHGGIRTIVAGDGATLVYDPTLVEDGGVRVPDDLIAGPPAMARGGQQVYTYGTRPDTMYPPPLHLSPDPDIAAAHEIPDPGPVDLSVPIIRRRLTG